MLHDSLLAEYISAFQDPLFHSAVLWKLYEPRFTSNIPGEEYYKYQDGDLLPRLPPDTQGLHFMRWDIVKVWSSILSYINISICFEKHFEIHHTTSLSARLRYSQRPASSMDVYLDSYTASKIVWDCQSQTAVWNCSLTKSSQTAVAV